MKAVSGYPSALYKYLPRQYAHDFVVKGEILFRNLTSFKQINHQARGDVQEGCHVDAPPSDVLISDPHTGRLITTGRFAMRTSVQEDRVFVLCMSKLYNNDLYAAFESDACVIIHQPTEFIRRCDHALKKMLHLDKAGCVHGDVDYYSPAHACKLDINDGYNIPFLKDKAFANQQEFRLCFGRKGAFNITKRIIVDQGWDTVPDHLNGTPRCQFLQVGDLSQIAELRYLESPAVIQAE